MAFHDKDIIILGAGIIGCTIARTLLEKGFNVKLVAKHLPGDEDIWYASNWAGALWHGARDLSANYKYLQTVSYRRFMNDYKMDKTCGVCKVRVQEYFDEYPSDDDLWFRAVNSNYEKLESHYSGNYAFGCEFDSVVIEPPRYLPFLKNQIESLGGQFIRKEIKDIQELYDEFGDSMIFVNASGVGPKYIKGIFDPDSYPNRGQNVLIKTRTDYAVRRAGKEYTYIIPRPMSGVVVLGGVNQPDQTHSEVDESIVKDEIRRAHELAPDIVSEDPEIAGVIVAIRPGRKGTFRLEKQKVGHRYLVHAYGTNGKGYAYSYGIAHDVCSKIEEIERDCCTSV